MEVLEGCLDEMRDVIRVDELLEVLFSAEVESVRFIPVPILGVVKTGSCGTKTRAST